jgi:hypothetical protein
MQYVELARRLNPNVPGVTTIVPTRIKSHSQSHHQMLEEERSMCQSVTDFFAAPTYVSFDHKHRLLDTYLHL